MNEETAEDTPGKRAAALNSASLSSGLEEAIAKARQYHLSTQHVYGYWVEELETNLEEAQEETKRLVEGQSEEIASLKKQVDELTASIGAMSENERQERIKKKVDDVPIPAMRKFIEPLYGLATSTAKTVKFTAKDDEDA
ncbi:MAG: hypothetical protein IIA62_04355, partial [Nitrospinae bacterium]|nr:hypothetical protein [Nitrospinota bacterium]